MRCKLLITGSAAWLNVVEASVLVRGIDGHGVAVAHHLLSADGTRHRGLRAEAGRRRHLSGHRRLSRRLCADAWPWAQRTGELPSPLARPLWSERLGSASGRRFQRRGRPLLRRRHRRQQQLRRPGHLRFRRARRGDGRGRRDKGLLARRRPHQAARAGACGERALCIASAPSTCISHCGPPRTSRASCRRTEKTHRPCSPSQARCLAPAPAEGARRGATGVASLRSFASHSSAQHPRPCRRPRNDGGTREHLPHGDHHCRRRHAA